ncbi:hypothetical protein D9M68_1010780 [compost metagenome]
MDARSRMNSMMKNAVFRANQMNGICGRMPNGPCQPPKNRVTSSAEMNTMPMYSPTKNMPHFIPAYSMW